MGKAWFETWFDTPYYHLLYQHRDEEEAEFFMDNLVAHLQIPPHSKVLDMACGKGRHALYLHDKGLDVTGFDLSENSIEAARKYKTDELAFYVHDIREPLHPATYDYAFNLFTSFGYFDADSENIDAIRAMATNLKSNGTLVIDFLNATYVMNNIVPESVDKRGDLTFTSKRYIKDGWVIKEIEADDKGEKHHFMEKVKLINYRTFKRWLDAAGLKIVDTFGNYKLEPFDEMKSARLIIVAKRI